MQNNLESDFHLSHGIINYLNAQYRGHFAFLNALQKLNSADFRQDVLVNAQKTLAACVKWNQDLMGGMPTISASWKYPETFEAQKVFDTLTQLKSELSEIEKILKHVSDRPIPLEDKNDLKYAVAAYLRYVYGRENFIKGFIEYATFKNNQPLLERYSQALPQAANEIKEANAIFKSVKEDHLSDDSLKKLVKYLPVLRGIHRSYLHDVNSYLSIYSESFTYELADFSVEEAKNWQALNFDTHTAGYWRAYDFRPDESSMWMNAGFFEPLTAFEWRRAGFVAPEAATWASINVRPEDAAIYKADNQTPETIHRIITKLLEKAEREKAAA